VFAALKADMLVLTVSAILHLTVRVERPARPKSRRPQIPLRTFVDAFKFFLSFSLKYSLRTIRRNLKKKVDVTSTFLHTPPMYSVFNFYIRVNKPEYLCIDVTCIAASKFVCNCINFEYASTTFVSSILAFACVSSTWRLLARSCASMVLRI